MTRLVLVPLDGSEVAEAALPAVQTFAGRQAVEIVLLAVIEVSTEFAAWVTSEEARVQRDLEQFITERQRYLEDVAARLAPHPTRIEVRVGAPAREIIACAEELDSPLIIMSSHGYGGFKLFMIGSVARQVIQSYRGAILVTRPDTEPSRFERLLLPVDGSAFSEQAIDTALEILGEPHPALHLVRVLGTPRWAPQAFNQGLVREYMEAYREEATEELKSLAARLEAAGYQATWELRPWGEVVEQIINTADAWQADMIAMATHGRGGLGRVLLGSVADGVLRRDTRPLLLIRPRDE